MTVMLALYADGEVAAKVEPPTHDTFARIIGSDDLETMSLPGLGLQLVTDAHGHEHEAPFNLAATLLLYGSGFRPVAPVLGDAVLLGCHDGHPAPVPDDLLDVL